MEKVRVGFIGVGGMAELHLRSLQDIEHAELTAVYDINSERVRQVSQQYGGTKFESAEQLLDSGSVDAIFICTPPFARDHIEELAAEKGIHLLSEKPVDLDLETARSKQKKILESGIIHSSGYCLRYLDTVQQAKKYLENKSIHMIHGYRLGGIPPAAWWPLMDKSGGQLVEQSTHQIDMIRYLAGEYKEVHSRYEQRSIQHIRPDATIPDYGIISFSMESGAIGSMSNSCMTQLAGRSEVELFGTDFYISMDRNGADMRIVDQEQDITIRSKMKFYQEQDRAFIEAIRTNRQDLVLGGYDDAVTTLAATLAMNESAKSGVPVTIQGNQYSASPS